METRILDPYSSPGILVCTRATSQAWLYLPHFQPSSSLGFKQMKQNSLPHRQCMCLQARTCSISMPQDTHARREGHPTTPTIFFLGQLRRIPKRLSSPEQSAFPEKKGENQVNGHSNGVESKWRPAYIWNHRKRSIIVSLYCIQRISWQKIEPAIRILS